MKFPTSTVLLYLALTSCKVSGASISFQELMGSYAWGASQSGITGPLALNIWNDATGALLSADNGDAADLMVTLSSTAGALGAGSFDYNATADTLRANQSFSGTVPVNNPGTRVINTIRITFAGHLTITNLNADWTSLNTAGVGWETSRLAALTPSGGYFSTIAVISPYLTHSSVNGSPSAGFFMLDSKGTVNNVGAANTTSGTSGSIEALTGTNGNSLLDYVDLGLASGTQIGGLEWVTLLEDVRGTGNSNTSFTSTLTSLQLSGSIAAAIPESGSGSLVLLSGALFARLRRRRNP